VNTAPIGVTQPPATSRPSSVKQTPAAASTRGNGTVHIVGGAQTPPGRRSVQFAREEPGQDILIPARWDVSEAEGDTPGKGVSLMSKLRALAITGGYNAHARSKSTGFISYAGGSSSAPHSPTREGFGSGLGVPGTLEEEGSDADAEQTADEQTVEDTARMRKKRRSRRPPWGSLHIEHSATTLLAGLRAHRRAE
jgi:phospholipase D1/2